MSAVREQVIEGLSERSWTQLADLESLHRVIQQDHERVIRSLDEAVLSADRKDLQIAWNQYRAVVANLSQITEEIESFRFTAG